MLFIIGDLHVTEQNPEQFLQLRQRVHELLQTLPIRCVILLGDVLDNHGVISRRAMDSVVLWLEELTSELQVICLVGNHDMDHNQRFCDPRSHWMAALRHMPGLTVVDRPMLLSAAGRKVVAVPYVPPGRFSEAVGQLDPEEVANSELLFAHQEFSGGELSESILSDCSEEYEFVPVCVSGHLHRAHWLRAAGRQKVCYTGSAFAHSFGQPKCWLWTWDGRELARHENGVTARTSQTIALKDVGSLDLSKLTKLHRLHVVAGSAAEFAAWQAGSEGKKVSGLCRVNLRLPEPPERQVHQPEQRADFDAQVREAVPAECRQMLAALCGKEKPCYGAL